MPKALRLARYGRTDVLKVKDVERPALSPVRGWNQPDLVVAWRSQCKS